MGHTIDISEWLDFDFYDLVWYWDERKADMADDPKKIGWWLVFRYDILDTYPEWQDDCQVDCSTCNSFRDVNRCD